MFTQQPLDFPRKNALVAGAAQGIGRAIAIRLAEDGLDVGLNDLPQNEGLLETLSDEIGEKSRTSCIVCVDVSVEAQVKEMIDRVMMEALGGLDVMMVYSRRKRSAYINGTILSDH